MIAPLSKIYLAGVNSYFNQAFSFLQRKGLMEVSSASEEITKDSSIKNTGSFYEVSRRLEELKETINFLGDGKIPKIKEPPKVKGFNIENIISKSAELRHRLSSIKNEISGAEKERSILSEALSMKIPFENLFSVRKIRWKVLNVPVKSARKFEQHINSFPLAAFIRLRFQPGKNMKSYIVFFHPAIDINADKFNAHAVDIPVSPGERAESVARRIESLNSELDAALEYKKHLEQYLPQALLLFDYYENLKIRERFRNESIFQTKKVFVITGWIKQKDYPAFKDEISHKFPWVSVDGRKPLRGEDVPIILENKKISEPYEALTSMYGTPLYGSVDPSPNMAVFFAFFFGLCLTDAFYGIIIAAVCAGFLFFKKPAAALRKFLWIGFLGGLFTILAGAATGGWFGDLPRRLPAGLGFIKNFTDRFVLFDPVKNALIFVGISIGCGFIQVMWGMVLKCLDDIRQGRIYSLIFEDVASICIQISVFVILGVYALDLFTLPAGLDRIVFGLLGFGAVSIVAYNMIFQKDVIFKILWSYYGLYSVITGNSFSDVLSYIRLFALGLTTGLLGMAINEFVWVIGGAGAWFIPVAVIVFIVGHTVSLFINMLGAAVHTLRLQYYEFFTKFIRTGGHYFNPLRNFIKYTPLSAIRQVQ
ncbi:MAG: hypothetical protein ABIJ15_02870 [bacterium]